ncbi:hypothetical protein Tco_0456499, partial [Tanacetum coccineum]
MASMNTRLNIKKLDGNIIQKHGVGFKQLGPGVEIGVHGVQDEKRIWFEVELQGAQGDREAEVNGVPGQEGAKGNVTEKKKVKESMKANLRKLLKYMARLTRRSPVNEARGAKDTLGILFWGVMHKRFGVITPWDICYDLKSLLSNVEQFKPLCFVLNVTDWYLEPSVTDPVMSSSSTVTYTSVYTNSEPGRVFWEADEELSDGGPEHSPSPNYVPGPEHPPSPVEVPYVPEPEYPEYLAPSDAEAPLEDHPLPIDASPTALLPGYVADSNSDDNPEEDPKEDHADYPADGGDDNDDDEPYNDNDDDDPSDDDDDDTDDEDEEPFCDNRDLS